MVITYGSATAYLGPSKATAHGSSTSQTITAGGAANAYALLRSSTSKLMMKMLVQYSDFTGHEYGEAKTNDGRKYKV